MNLDLNNTQAIGIDKFQIEAEELKIKLTRDELTKLVKLYECKEHFNKIRNVPAVYYDKAIRSVVPVLSKNQDKKYEANQNFKIGWTLSSNANLMYQ